MLHHRANDDVPCAVAFDDDDYDDCDCGDDDEWPSVNRIQQYYCVDCAMVSIVVYLHINAVVKLVSHVSYPMVVMIYQPNMQANPRDEYSADAYYVPNQQFHVCDVDSQYSLLIHLYVELHHMILMNRKHKQMKKKKQITNQIQAF